MLGLPEAPFISPLLIIYVKKEAVTTAKQEGKGEQVAEAYEWQGQE